MHSSFAASCKKVLLPQRVIRGKTAVIISNVVEEARKNLTATHEHLQAYSVYLEAEELDSFNEKYVSLTADIENVSRDLGGPGGYLDTASSFKSAKANAQLKLQKTVELRNTVQFASKQAKHNHLMLASVASVKESVATAVDTLCDAMAEISIARAAAGRVEDAGDFATNVKSPTSGVASTSTIFEGANGCNIYGGIYNSSSSPTALTESGMISPAESRVVVVNANTPGSVNVFPGPLPTSIPVCS